MTKHTPQCALKALTGNALSAKHSIISSKYRWYNKREREREGGGEGEEKRKVEGGKHIDFRYRKTRS